MSLEKSESGREAGGSHSSFMGQQASGEAMQVRLTADKTAWHQHLKGYSAEMRRKPTEGENKLWQALRNRQLGGVKFRRQHAIGHFIVDFISIDHQLIIEVDGDIHTEESQAEYDAGRTHELQAQGYRILRFTNNQAMNISPQVLTQISQYLQPTL